MNKRPKISDWESGKIEIPDDEYIPIFIPVFYSFLPFPREKLIYFLGLKTGFQLGPEWSDILEK